MNTHTTTLQSRVTVGLYLAPLTVMFRIDGEGLTPINEACFMRGLRRDMVKMIERSKQFKEKITLSARTAPDLFIGHTRNAPTPCIVGSIEAPWLLRRADIPNLFYRIQQELRLQLQLVRHDQSAATSRGECK